MNTAKSFFAVLVVSAMAAVPAMAVTSVITRHNSGTTFLQGKTENTIVTSSGTIRLSPRTQDIDTGQWLEDVWSIHTMLTDADGAIYLGTGPDAKVFRYAAGQMMQVYPREETTVDPSDDGTTIQNEHVFALGKDLAGRLLVGVSGTRGRLVRLDNKQAEVVFEDDRVQYIFAMTMDDENNLYLGTGPEGLVFRLNAFCQNPEVIYDARDNNILSLVVADGMVYAGSDGRGLVYKIDPQQKQATVLYDTDQDEVTSLLMDADGNVYAAATSAAAAMLQLKAKPLSIQDAPGRSEEAADAAGVSPMALNADDEADDEDSEDKKPSRKAPRPPAAKAAGHIYKINPDGFVTDIFAEIAVFYTMTEFDGKLLLGTGNKGQLYAVTDATEEKAMYYEDKKASQVTSVLPVGDALYLGLSNPARLIRLDKGFQSEGVYRSDLIDAGQPARWGKMSLDAVIPDGCRVLMASRSGNVEEPNDATFSDWSPDVVMTEATDLNCPLGRFCQYRLTLQSETPLQSPEIREVAAASVIPNLPPKVHAVQTQRSRDKNAPFIQEIAFSASDENKDMLEFQLDFRKLGRSGWICLEDELDQPRFEWDSRTVEDGRYEVRVTADDYKSNSTETALTGSRISDPIVIDNSAPTMNDVSVTVSGRSVRLQMSVDDEWTIIGKVRYTVDSNDKWISTLPTDWVYDTRSEQFDIAIDDLTVGDHVVALAVSDDLGNTMYKTFEVTVE